jgi:hypothetical protein
MECNENFSEEKKSIFKKIKYDSVKQSAKFMRLILKLFASGLTASDLARCKTFDAARYFAIMKSNIDISDTPYAWISEFPKETEDYFAHSSGKIGDEYFFSIKKRGADKEFYQMKPEDFVSAIYKYFYNNNPDNRIFDGKITRHEAEIICDYNLIEKSSDIEKQKLAELFDKASEHLSKKINIKKVTNADGKSEFVVFITDKLSKDSPKKKS